MAKRESTGKSQVKSARSAASGEFLVIKQAVRSSKAWTESVRKAVREYNEKNPKPDRKGLAASALPSKKK